jgi:hypothetical protein
MAKFYTTDEAEERDQEQEVILKLERACNGNFQVYLTDLNGEPLYDENGGPYIGEFVLSYVGKLKFVRFGSVNSGLVKTDEEVEDGPIAVEDF